MAVETRRTVHMGMTRAFLAGLIRDKGAKFVSPGWAGTDEEAIEAVLSGPEIVTGCACPKMPDGACAGEDGWRLRQSEQT